MSKKLFNLRITGVGPGFPSHIIIKVIDPHFSYLLDMEIRRETVGRKEIHPVTLASRRSDMVLRSYSRSACISDLRSAGVNRGEKKADERRVSRVPDGTIREMCH